MTAPSIEFPTVEELRTRREKLLQRAGMSIDELLDGEHKRTLDMKRYMILEEIRDIDFLLEE